MVRNTLTACSGVMLMFDCECSRDAEIGIDSLCAPAAKALSAPLRFGTSTAISNLRRICEKELEGQYDLEIIDVLQYPDLAEDEKILATPTLIKSLPLPLRRVIGDLSDTDKVLLGLEVQSVRLDDPDAKGAR